MGGSSSRSRCRTATTPPPRPRRHGSLRGARLRRALWPQTRSRSISQGRALRLRPLPWQGVRGARLHELVDNRPREPPHLVITESVIPAMSRAAPRALRHSQLLATRPTPSRVVARHAQAMEAARLGLRRANDLRPQSPNVCCGLAVKIGPRPIAVHEEWRVRLPRAPMKAKEQLHPKHNREVRAGHVTNHNPILVASRLGALHPWILLDAL